MRSFDYIRPTTITDAIAALDQAGESRLLAGGTDLLTLMKHGIADPHQVIDIKRLPELDDTIEPSGDGLTIGALATLAQLEDDPLVRGEYTALAEAAALAASPQLRNMATIGGNLLQRPRCWYFRSEHVQCWLKGGDDCPAREGENRYHALFGESPCVAVHPSDLATALVALDAEVNLRGPQDNRVIPLEEFFAEPTADRRTETTIAPNEIITSIRLPVAPDHGRSTYLKAMDRKVWAFATAGVAASLVIHEGRITRARLVLGGVAPIPWRVPDAESALVGEAPTAELFEHAAEVALRGATPLSGNLYKRPLLTTLIRRALESVAVPPPGDLL